MYRAISAGLVVLALCMVNAGAQAGTLGLGLDREFAEAANLVVEIGHKSKKHKHRHWMHKHRKHHGRHHNRHRHHRHKHQNGGFFLSFGANGPSLHVGPVHRKHARRCHGITTDGYYHGRYARIGGTMCYDRAGNGYLVDGSRYLIHYY